MRAHDAVWWRGGRSFQASRGAGLVSGRPISLGWAALRWAALRLARWRMAIGFRRIFQAKALVRMRSPWREGGRVFRGRRWPPLEAARALCARRPARRGVREAPSLAPRARLMERGEARATARARAGSWTRIRCRFLEGVPCIHGCLEGPPGHPGRGRAEQARKTPWSRSPVLEYFTDGVG